MAVNIIWSTTNGGGSIVGDMDHGTLDNGMASSGEEIFVRHDGKYLVSNVSFYIEEYVGVYSGGATAAADFAEIIGWGNNVTVQGFGGALINWNAAGTYPASDWSTYALKAPTNGFVHMTGTGDSALNAVPIPTTTGASIAGQIQSGASPNVRFKMRIQVPSTVNIVGVRQFSQVINYTYTS